MIKLQLLFVLFLLSVVGWGQVSLTNAYPSSTIDFSSMQAGVGNGAFTGAGFQSSPTIGQLNSNAWAVTGWNDGNLAFGGTQTTADTDYTRDIVIDAVTTVGFYAYSGSPQSSIDPCLMFQPGDTDFTPGTLTLRIQNNGTTNITQLYVSYNIYVRNDQPSSNSFNFSSSSDNITYTPVTALDYTSIEVSDALGWLKVSGDPSRSTTITGLDIAPGAYYYIRWSGADVLGSGNRDEFGLDDIVTAATYSPPCSPPSNSSGTITWDGTDWIGGMPNLTTDVIIDGAYSTASGSFEARSLVINATKTVTILTNTSIRLEYGLSNNGTFTIEDNGSLVQVCDNAVNTGNIIMHRTANIRLNDYVYWSSPVANFPVTSLSPSTPTSVIWKWNPTVANTNGSYGNWQNANENMGIAKGYIVRGPSGFNNTTIQAYTASFTGMPNNGIYTPTISRGTLTGYDDNWNLVGNPYPSAIKALDFLNANPNLDGFVNLWTHGTLPSSAPNPFYGTYTYNYTPNDYITFNGTGPSTPVGFDGYIAAGQGFFVMMEDGAAATETITFNNSMRSTGYDNAQFYRSSASSLVNVTEKHSIWLDLVSSTNAVNRMLVGYVAGATLGRDRLYDAVTKVDNNQHFYSLLTSEAFKIQGRPVPFNMNDQVPLGVKLPASGSYTIALGATDGLFQGVAYPIFLEDKLLNVIHDLKQAPYSFTAVAGKFDNRFVLRYTNVNLGNDDLVIAEDHVAVATGNQEILVKSQIEPIKNITVYDVLGRVIFEKSNINANEFTIQNRIPNQQALIVRITLENRQTINKKIIF